MGVKGVTLASGNLTVSGSQLGGVTSTEGNIIIQKGVMLNAATGDDGIPLFAKILQIDASAEITYPENVKGLCQDESTNSQYFVDNDDKIIRHIILETSDPTAVPYALWLSRKQVNSKNCGDIFGDGKASYNDTTKVLMLNDPTIYGAYKNGDSTIKIASGSSLNIVGSYQIPASDNVTYGVFSNDSIKLDGDFNFTASKNAIYCSGDLDVSSGSLTAKSSEAMAASVGKTFKVENGVKKVELEGGNVPVLASTITLGDKEKITDPSGGAVAYVKSAEKYTIATSAGTVKKAVIEYQGPVAPTTQPPTTQPATQPTTTPFDPGKPGLTGSGTANAPYLIQSIADWNTLSAFIAKGGNTSGMNFKLTKNIGASTMLGTESNAFKGIFDGSGHTLTLSLKSDEKYCAPFSYIEGATIRNLIVSGTVNGAIHCSGMVGSINSSSDSLIENCTVSAMITSSAAYCGGFVGHGGKMSKTTVRN